MVPRTNGFDCSAEYVIIGGLVFTRLVCPMLEDKRSKGKLSAVFDLVHFNLAESFAPAVPPGEEEEQVLVLTEILAAPLNYGYETNKWAVLGAVNGERVRSLRGLYRAYTEYAGEFFEFKFSHGGEGVVLGAKECRESEADILRMHAVPAIVSPAVRESVAAPVRVVAVWSAAQRRRLPPHAPAPTQSQSLSIPPSKSRSRGSTTKRDGTRSEHIWSQRNRRGTSSRRATRAS